MREGTVKRRCTTCARYAENQRGKWVCPDDEDHPLKWSARVDVAPVGSVKRQQRRKSGMDTKNEALAWLADVQVKVSKGDLVDPSRMTFRQYFDKEWKPHIETAVLPKTGKPRRPTTVQSYEDLMEMYVLPTLGDIRLQSITRSQLVSLYHDLIESGGRDGDGLSPRTVAYVHSVVRKSLHDAERWRYVRRNEAALASEDVPGSDSESESDSLQHWNEVQLETFWRHIGTDHDYFSMFYTKAWTGVRRGELLALRWSDLDLSRGTMRVSRNRVSVRYEVREGPPKTKRGNRVIPLAPETVAVLRTLRDSEEVHSIDGYVFVRPDGQPHHPERVSKVFAQLVAEADLEPISLHGLRHTFATILLSRGVPVYKVSRILGHSSISVTVDLYGGYIPEEDEQIMRMISEAQS